MKIHTMKKISLFLSAALLSVAAYAQPEVTSAFNANRDGKYEEAMGYIEQASSNPKATSKEKYWRFRGDIYLNLAMDSTLAMKYPKAYDEALASYTKALEMSKDYVQEIAGMVDRSRRIEDASAVKAYKAKNTCVAAKHYDNLVNSSKLFGSVDSVYIYYGGICYQDCGEVDKALACFTKCTEINYQAADCYSRIGNMLVTAGRKEDALKILSEARAKYPRNSSILTAEVNIYIEEKNYDKAHDILVKLTEADPNNESIWFVLGVTYEKNNNIVEAENAYKKAIALKADYFDPYYNMAVIYYNRGIEKFKECDAIPPRESAKFEACSVERKAIYATAADYFQKCYDLAPDASIKKPLAECYRKSGQTEKANGIK